MYTGIKHYLAGSCVALSMFLGGCFGFCGAAPNQSEISVYLTDDVSGTPVRAPAFTEQGMALTPICQDAQTSDPELCTSQLLVVGYAMHEITVSAPGYAPQVVTVDTEASDSVHLAIQLHPIK